VTDDAALTMRALWSKRLDGALKTVEDVLLTGHHYLERLVVIVSARLAFCHGVLLL
jgi:hypothetical protein